jgi:membrane-bound lytic murein transglycosylase F
MTTIYDDLFRQYGNTYLQQVDWRWFKAQGMEESGLNPDAKSSAGAVGIMQLMPDTAEEVAGDLGIGVWDLTDPEFSIRGGIYYMSLMWGHWIAKRTQIDRLRLAQASYNAGLGNIRKAQKLANNAAAYDSIIHQLPDVTGAQNALETTWYVIRIAKFYSELCGETP